MVGLTSGESKSGRTVLALFDTASGKAIKVLRDIGSTESKKGSVFEAALSRDGAMAASMIYDPSPADPHVALEVRTVADGKVIATLLKLRGDSINDCTSQLDFSEDGKELQCGSKAYDIATGAVRSLSNGKDYVFPLHADFSAVGKARAPNGQKAQITRTGDSHELELWDLKKQSTKLVSPLSLHDFDTSIAFAPDSIGLLEVHWAYHKHRGIRAYQLPVMRKMTAVGVWDIANKTQTRTFVTNRRYVEWAWARDSSVFGLISNDLRIDLFRR